MRGRKIGACSDTRSPAGRVSPGPAWVGAGVGRLLFTDCALRSICAAAAQDLVGLRTVEDPGVGPHFVMMWGGASDSQNTLVGDHAVPNRVDTVTTCRLCKAYAENCGCPSPWNIRDASGDLNPAYYFLSTTVQWLFSGFLSRVFPTPSARLVEAECWVLRRRSTL